MDDLKARIKSLEAENLHLKSSLSTFALVLQRDLNDSQDELAQRQKELDTAHERNNVLVKAKDRLSKAVLRLPDKVKKQVDKLTAQSIYDSHGVITPAFRECARDMIKNGTPQEGIDPNIYAVAKALSVPLTGHVSARSAGRTNIEGLVAAHVQIIDEQKKVKRESFIQCTTQRPLTEVYLY